MRPTDSGKFSVCENYFSYTKIYVVVLYSILNNVAIAVKYALEIHGLKRILVVDWDVHHGNGIQNMFYQVTKKTSSRRHILLISPIKFRILECCTFHYIATTMVLFFLESQTQTLTLWEVGQEKDLTLTFLGTVVASVTLSICLLFSILYCQWVIR